MRPGFILKSFIFPNKIEDGLPAPGLSLTADNGGWVRSLDYVGRKKLLLVFIKCWKSEISIKWLQSIQDNLHSFQSNDIAVFGVSNSKPGTLRQEKEKHGIEFPLLYDPFGIDSRRLGMSSRRLRCIDGFVIINQEGCIQYSLRDIMPVKSLLNEWVEIANNEHKVEREIELIDASQAIALIKVGYLIIDVRTGSEFEADHIPGAIHLPIDDIQNRYSDLNQQNRLVFICQAGGRAFSAAEFMASIGSTEIAVVEGGMSAWSGPRITGGEVES